MAELSKLERLKFNIMESKYPFFTDAELQQYLDIYGGDVRKASYNCLIAKSEDTSLSVSGLSTADTSEYFKRLAQKYRPTLTGNLEGF